MDPERTLNPLPDLGIMRFMSTALKVWSSEGSLRPFQDPQGQTYLNKNANMLPF